MVLLPTLTSALLPVVLAVGVLASCNPAAALDDAGRCFQGKMRASRVGAAAWLRCAASGTLEDERGQLCLARVDERVRRLLAVADAKAAAKGFACPGTAESLGLGGPAVWPLRLLDDYDGSATEACRRLRAGALRRLATALGRCVEKAESASTDPSYCQAVAGVLFDREVEETAEECGAIDAAAAAGAVQAEVDETASRLRVRCGDARVDGLEDCDDGNEADGDGCNAACRRETCVDDGAGGQSCGQCPAGGCGPEACERFGAEVRCVTCPSDAVPTADHRGCRCPDGYDGEPGACTDVDECAGDPCAGLGPCVNLPGSWGCATACTAEAFHAALASCGAPSGSIVFDCADTVIAIPPATSAARDVDCDGLRVDGAGRGISFALAPSCRDTVVLPEQCPGGLEPGGTCACPDVDGGDAFLVLRGDGNVVRDLGVAGFFDGIHTRGRGALVEGVRFEANCDDAFGNGPGGVANVFRDLVATDGCDKCSENDGSIADTDADPRVPGRYNARFEGVGFDRCLTPLRMAGGGRYLLDEVTMRGGNEEFPCDGPRFSSSGVPGELVVEMKGSLVDGCRRGVRFGSGAEGLVDSTRISGCSLRGLRVGSAARVSVSRTTIEVNGGGGSAEDGFGGVAVLDGGQADLGGGLLEIGGAAVTSAGANTLCANAGAMGQALELFAEGPDPVSAAGNWWCTMDPAADRIVGPATLEPLLDRAPDAYIPLR